MDQLTKEIHNCPFECFGISKKFEILRRKARIDEILRGIENVFSLPSFLIIIANLSTCACVLALYLRVEEWEGNLKLSFIDWAFYVLNSSACLIIMLWTAGGIPIQERRFKDVFYQKAQSRMICTGYPKENRVERWLFDKPDFAFSGCGILSYRRSTLFAVAGTLITYTMLVANA
ncbi:uncharacterized protein TNCT_129241 [Trichonephila clavata]|uniref:Uncharacterized protein n=1 Tax=Trichonephila clavata TaxID=2740835 RepID=A0A8X6H7B5_TRICU|nr:uncharacterized protein TNCT_129241 [Trichonephila clavata]